jgi:hypothetical protein
MFESFGCFLIEETPLVTLYARRYAVLNKCGWCPPCTGNYSFHDASVQFSEEISERGTYLKYHDPKDYPDAPFPGLCSCGYAFKATDEWQISPERVYERVDTGALCTLRNAEPGAMWNAWWVGPHAQGEDGKSMMVMMPGQIEWGIDCEANNCDRKGDPAHRCWIRHGAAPNLTVDKNTTGSKFSTCKAGSGSIGVPGWHGFMVDGILRRC